MTHEAVTSVDAPERVSPERDSPEVEASERDAAADGEVGVDVQSLAARVEAVLISRSKAVSPEAIARGLGLIEHPGGDDAGEEDAPTGADAASRRAAAEAVLAAVDRLNKDYEQTGRCFRIERVAGGLRIVTLSAFAEAVQAFRPADQPSRLSRPAVETLAIIAYRQPVTRAQIEAIRGVACGEVLRSLLERRLIAVVGRAEELGRPMLYGTTRQFLQAFGLSSLEDLPSQERGGQEGKMP